MENGDENGNNGIDEQGESPDNVPSPLFTVHTTTQWSYSRIISFFCCFSMGKMVI
jgi:hypothetical protein